MAEGTIQLSGTANSIRFSEPYAITAGSFFFPYFENRLCHPIKLPELMAEVSGAFKTYSLHDLGDFLFGGVEQVRRLFQWYR